MARIPSDIEEQVIQEDEPVSAPPTPSAQEHHDRSARSEGGSCPAGSTERSRAPGSCLR